jgi:hypothetical protein
VATIANTPVTTVALLTCGDSSLILGMQIDLDLDLASLFKMYIITTRRTVPKLTLQGI